MSLDIKTITDAIAKKIAYDVDCENKMDGKLNKKEFYIFRTRATEAGVDTEVLNDLSDKFFAKGSNKADKADKADKKDDKKVDNKTKVDNNSDAGNDSDTTKLSLYQTAKQYEEVTLALHKRGTSDLTLDNLVTVLEGMYARKDGDVTTKKGAVIDDVENMIEIIKGINGKKDSRKIKEALRKSDKFAAGTANTDLVEQIIQITEKDQIREEGVKLSKIYNELLTDEAHKGKTPEELIKLTIQKAEEGTDKYYYLNEAKKELKAHAQNLVGQKEFELIAKTPITDAEKYLDGRTNTTHKDSKIGQAAVEDQKVAATVKEAIVNFTNRLKTIETVTPEELKNSELPKSLQKTLSENYNIKHKNSDGKSYNFKEIYDIIESHIGADAIVMGQVDPKQSEFKLIKRDLIKSLGRELSDNELIKLIEFCGAKTDLKDKEFKTALKEMANSVIPGFISGAAGEGIDINILAHGNSSLTPKDINTLKELGAFVKDFDGTVLVNISWNALAAGIRGLSANALLTLLRVVTSGKEKNELNVLRRDYAGKQEELKNIDDYEKYLVDKEGPVVGKIFAAIAAQYADKDGNIDAAAYLKRLDEIAGPGSPLHYTEMLGYQLTNQGEEETDAEKIKHTYEQDKYANTPEKRETVEVPVENYFHSDWNRIPLAYDCLIGTFGSAQRAARALKIAQGIENVDLYDDVETLKLLVDLSYQKDWNAMRAFSAKGFNFDTFKYYYNNNDLRLRLPERFAGCTKDPNFDFRVPAYKNPKAAGKGTTPTNTYKITPGANGNYWVKFYNENNELVKTVEGSFEEIQTAVKNYKEEHKDIEVTEK